MNGNTVKSAWKTIGCQMNDRGKNVVDVVMSMSIAIRL
jgi:hypothetical protein